MTKQELLDILQKLLQTENDLAFLLELNEENLQTLVACVRSRLDQN